jgi:hypothetical protein
MTGATIVIFALISYSIAIISEQRQRSVSKFILRFLTIGVILDIIATTFMIIGSSRGPFTLHGVLGYSSLAAMLIDTILIWRLYRAGGVNVRVPALLHNYTRIAYAWWVTAFITGLLLVVLR